MRSGTFACANFGVFELLLRPSSGSTLLQSCFTHSLVKNGSSRQPVAQRIGVALFDEKLLRVEKVEHSDRVEASNERSLCCERHSTEACFRLVRIAHYCVLKALSFCTMQR